MKKIHVYLFLIFAIACFLRFYKLGEVPNGFHRDEAFLGYNAYSILKTGRDINGSLLPLHLKSFIFSPAGYAYVSVPFIYLFGLSSFSIRCASAFFGSLTIIVVFFLTLNIFSKEKNSLLLALISSLVLAINPWHINLSRTATENVVVVFFISLGFLFFTKWVKQGRMIFLFSSFLLFGLSLETYQAPRAFLPILIPLCIFLLIPFKEKRKVIQTGLAFFITIIIPLVFILSSKELSLRIRTVSIFASENTKLVLNEQISQDGVVGEYMFLTRMFHNKVVGYGTQVLQNYFNHFSYNFLFTDYGFPDRYRIPLSGLLYLYEFPFLLIGIYCILMRKKKNEILLLLWVLAAPIGSALTSDDIPNVQRTLLIFPALSIVISLGIYTCITFFQGKKLPRVLYLVLCAICFYQISFYLHQYYDHYSYYRPWYRNDGYKLLVTNVNERISYYKKAIITNRESAPTIFFLFYSQYDPRLFQEKTKIHQNLDFDRIAFDKYEFSEEECPSNTLKGVKKNILYIDSGSCKVSKAVNTIKTIKRLDNSVVFYISDK